MKTKQDIAEQIAIDADPYSPEFGWQRIDLELACHEMARQVLRWIPKEEDSPKEGQLVLTKPEGGGDTEVDMCWFKNGRFIMRFPYQPSCYSSTYKFREDITESTAYWKPLEWN